MHFDKKKQTPISYSLTNPFDFTSPSRLRLGHTQTHTRRIVLLLCCDQFQSSTLEFTHTEFVFRFALICILSHTNSTIAQCETSLSNSQCVISSVKFKVLSIVCKAAGVLHVLVFLSFFCVHRESLFKLRHFALTHFFVACALPTVSIATSV